MSGEPLKALMRTLQGGAWHEGFDADAHALDVSGWNSEHPIFKTVLEPLKATKIIEVGTWKGASAIHMANILRDADLDAHIVCVDTFLGSAEHWIVEQWRTDLLIRNGRSAIYEQFMANVVKTGHQERISPMPLSSLQAARVFQSAGVTVDAIYIDASHQEEDVYADIQAYWPLLRAGGAMMGDDYHANWPGVIKAANRFAYEAGQPLRTQDSKWLVLKPATG